MLQGRYNKGTVLYLLKKGGFAATQIWMRNAVFQAFLGVKYSTSSQNSLCCEWKLPQAVRSTSHTAIRKRSVMLPFSINRQHIRGTVTAINSIIGKAAHRGASV